MKKLVLLMALGLLSFCAPNVNGFLTIPLTKRPVSRSQYSNRLPGSLRSAEDIARKTGETFEIPKQKESFSLDIAGVKVFDFVPSVVTDFVKNMFFGKDNLSLGVLLRNSEDLFYVGDVFVGSNQQNMSVIFDTGSDYLVIGDSSCSNCVSKRFYSS
jgi:hypothetical protein